MHITMIIYYMVIKINQKLKIKIKISATLGTVTKNQIK